MPVTDYELYELPPRWLFLKLETEDAVGWGEPIVEGRTATVRTAVSELVEQHIVGRDPGRIADRWQTMYRGEFYRGGPILMSAIAGIDQALWDLKGKRHGVPVYDLLGGACRDRIEVFRWVGGDRPENVAEEARRLVDAGYRTLKMDATARMPFVDSPKGVADICTRVERVREEVGPEVDVAVDFRGRVSKAMAGRLLDRLEPYEPLFVEEPVLPEHQEALASIAERTTVPLAAGERLYSRWDVKSLLTQGGVDVVQPNVSHAGGITETKKIADMSAAFDVAVAPNCPTGPVTLAASLQVDAIAPNFFVQDHGYEVQPAGDSMLHEYVENDTIFEVDEGYMDLPTEPGLGLRIDEDALERQREENIGWHNPVYRHDDGSVADW